MPVGGFEITGVFVVVVLSLHAANNIRVQTHTIARKLLPQRRNGATKTGVAFSAALTGGLPMPATAVAASATPTPAPSGNKTCATRRKLVGRSKPSRPMMTHRPSRLTSRSIGADALTEGLAKVP